MRGVNSARYDFASTDEALRLERLSELAILDTPNEAEFDTIVILAQRLLACPIALVSLVDDHRQWFKARCGLEVDGTPRDHAFCAHAILRDDIMVVEDATRDPRFADNPLVTGPPHIRFYAGAPLRPSISGPYGDLPAIGTLCVVGTEPRLFDADARHMLRRLADIVEGLIRARAAKAAAINISRDLDQKARLLGRTNRQLRQAERLAAVGSWRLDLATNGIEWSDQVYALHELAVGALPSLAGAMDFYPAQDRERLESAIQHAIATGESFQMEADFRTAAGHSRRVQILGEVEWADETPIAVIGVFRDITRQFLHEQELHRVANTDSLTSLPNRKMFDERLGELAGQAATAPYAILLIDLDGFKPINDTFGHQAGDEVLQAIAQRLRGRSFAHGFAARLGGDEFVLLVTRPRDCAALPEMVQTVLRELRHVVEHSGVRLAVTATVGAALHEHGPSDPYETLRNADLALYAAKRTERGSGRVFGSDERIKPWQIRNRRAA